MPWDLWLPHPECPTHPHPPPPEPRPWPTRERLRAPLRHHTGGLASPVSEGPTPVGWPISGLRPLVPVLALLTLGLAQSTQLRERGEGGGPSAGQERVLLGRSHLCSLHLSVGVYVSVLCPLLVCLRPCLCLCFPPSISLLLSANLPRLLCSSAITPGQECYLISSLLAASGLHPLPFFLPAAACLPWQP